MTALSRRSLIADVAIGLTLGASGVPGYLDQPWVALAQLAMGAAVAIRRIAPFTGAVVISLAFVFEAMEAVHTPEDQVALIGIPVLAYAVAAYRPRWIAITGLAAMVAAVNIEIPISDQSGQWWYSTGIVLIGGLPGFFMFGRRLEVRRLEDTARQLSDQRDEQAAVAVTQERARLARELHDVVSHSVGAMMIQAAAAEQVFDSAPDKARRALAEVQLTGRQAVTELHRLLGLLRDEQAPGARTAPQPNLVTIEHLIVAVQAEGVNDIAYQVRGRPQPMNPALELSGYRIVQECLTNSRKHAPGARVDVQITWPPLVPEGCLDIDVTDSGSTRSARGSTSVTGPSTSSAAAGEPVPVGHGLVGIRERVALFGGALEAGRTAAGGYRTHAVLGRTGAPGEDSR